MLGISRSRCRAVQRVLWDYANQCLSEGPMEMVENHLPSCPACRRELASLCRAQSLLLAYKEQTPPPPRLDWEDLRQQLTDGGRAPARGAAFATEARVYRMVDVPEDRRRRTRLVGAGGWLSSIIYAGSATTFLLTAAIGYRLFQPARPPVSSATSSRARQGQPSGPAKSKPNTFHPTPANNTDEAANAGNGGFAGWPLFVDLNGSSMGSVVTPKMASASLPNGNNASKRTQEPRAGKQVANGNLERSQKQENSTPRAKPGTAGNSGTAGNGGMQFALHSPTQGERAPDEAPDAGRRYLLDQIRPVGDSSSHHAEPKLLSGDDDAAY